MNHDAKGLSLAQQLVRSVVRSFYETRHILLVDALVMHSALRDDDLAYLMGMNTKDLHKLCGRLREDRLLAVHTRAEQREGQQRANNRTYYYINYQQTVDAIKWRVYQLSKSVQRAPVPLAEKKEYFCPVCKSEWTMLQVLDNCGPQGFLCHKCQGVLTHDTQRNSDGHQQSSRMNDQLKFITDLLPKIDSVKVPDHDFDIAISRALPVAREHTHQIAATTVIEPSKPTAVKGLANIGPNSMKVNISTADGPSQAEKEAEREYKERIAKQNALPAWMVQSTVSGESYSGGTGPNPILATESRVESKEPTKQGLEANKNHEELDDYFARLKAEQAAEKEEEEEDEDEDEDEEEDEFEDVPGVNSTIGTPVVIPPTANVAENDDRPPKRAKTETPAEDSEEEDLEFEDV